MNWADLFERADAHETDVGAIRAALAERRKDASESEGDDD